MRRYLGTLYLATVYGFVFRTVASHCLTRVKKDYKLELGNPSNLSEYNLTVTLRWNVTEGTNITSFLYQYKDIDGPVARKKRFAFPPPFFPPPNISDKEESCDGIDDDIWAVLENGTSVQCRLPCDGVMPRPPEFNLLCERLKHNKHTDNDFKSVSKDTRTLVLPVKFGRAYDFELYAYDGWNPVSECGVDLRGVAVFCRHELIVKHGVKPDVADEFCRQEQVLGRNTHTSGPVSNFSLFRKNRDMSINRGVAVFRWQDPHDVSANVTIIHYGVNVLKNGKPEEERVLLSDKVDGFYNVTVRDIIFDEIVELKITPITNISNCNYCTEYGVEDKRTVIISDIDACVGDDITARYCDQNASCVDFQRHNDSAGSCHCAEGYAGNGIDVTFDGGAGCFDFDSCSAGGARNDTCVPEAFCWDNPPPSRGVNCSCPSNYFGDGYRSGSGCWTRSLFFGLIVGLPATIIAISVTALLVRRWRRVKKRKFEAEVSHFLNGDVISLPPGSANGNAELGGSENGVFGKQWELDRNRIELKGIIGRGNFGVVRRAMLKTVDGYDLVAVKMTSENPSEPLRKDFLSEISMIGGIGSHPNLIGMIGCCTVGEGPILLVSEHMKYGDLLHFLWNARELKYREIDPIYSVTELDVYRMGSQIACGMNYMRNARVIHGDLAARNVLVGKGLVCKISDFGLANDVYRYGAIKGAVEKTVPLKWVSPERMMNGRVPITWRSDVWSFGILLYETITLGAAPYPDIRRDELFEKLKSGYRMKKPDFCSPYLYNIVSKCWEWAPSKRPSFIKLEEDLAAPYASPDTNTYISLVEVVPNLDGGSERGARACNGIDLTLNSHHAVEETETHNEISLTVSNERACDEGDAPARNRIPPTLSNENACDERDAPARNRIPSTVSNERACDERDAPARNRIPPTVSNECACDERDAPVRNGIPLTMSNENVCDERDAPVRNGIPLTMSNENACDERDAPVCNGMPLTMSNMHTFDEKDTNAHNGVSLIMINANAVDVESKINAESA